nr:hypothetical protein [Tanacetum cinerariifolium]
MTTTNSRIEGKKPSEFIRSTQIRTVGMLETFQCVEDVDYITQDLKELCVRLASAAIFVKMGVLQHVSTLIAKWNNAYVVKDQLVVLFVREVVEDVRKIRDFHRLCIELRVNIRLRNDYISKLRLYRSCDDVLGSIEMLRHIYSDDKEKDARLLSMARETQHRVDEEWFHHKTKGSWSCLMCCVFMGVCNCVALCYVWKNKVLFCEQIAVLKRDISYKDSEISVLKRSQIPNNSIKGLGYESYHAVPPPPTGLFLPSKLDLSNTGLEEFKQSEFESCRPKSCKIESKNDSKDIPNEVKEYLNAPLVKDRVSNNKDCSVKSSIVVEKKTIVPTIAKVEVVRPKQQQLGK